MRKSVYLSGSLCCNSVTLRLHLAVFNRQVTGLVTGPVGLATTKLEQAWWNLLPPVTVKSRLSLVDGDSFANLAAVPVVFPADDSNIRGCAMVAGRCGVVMDCR